MNRRAFTLVELLVVITIIGMLMALLVPAVNAAREMARRTQCLNNLHQLGLGCLTGESLNGGLPSGGWGYYFLGDPDRGFGASQPGAWGYAILPYIEQNAAFQLGADGEPDKLTAPQTAGAKKCAMTPVPMFICPTRRAADRYPCTWNDFKNCDTIGSDDYVNKSDYAACSGSNDGDIGVQCGFNQRFDDALRMLEKERWAGYNLSIKSLNGLIYFYSSVDPVEVTDGMANTYMLGEKYLNPYHYTTGEGDGADNECVYAGYDNDNQRSCYYSNSRFPRQDRAGWGNSDIFGSAHSGTFGMTMGDNSTHWIPYTIDPQVHSVLGNRRSGQYVEIPK